MSELQDLVDSLAARIGRSVAIDDHRFRLLVFSSHGHEIDDVRRASILQREAPKPVRDLLEQLGVQNAIGPMRIDAVPELGLRPRICLPIRFDGFLLGYMWLIEDKAPFADAHLADCVDALREAGPLIYRERMLEDHTRESERQRVVELLDVAGDRRAAAARALIEEGMLAPARAYGVIVVDARDRGVQPRAEARIVAALAALERARRTLPPHGCLVGNVGGRGVLIAAVPRASDGVAELSRLAWRVHEDVLGSSGEPSSWRVGQGPTVADLARVVLSYKAALDAIEVAAAVPELGDVAVWDELGAWRLLCLIPDDDRAYAAIHPGLSRLAKARDGRVLLDTLERYLDHGGDAQQTANDLYIHRTSLYGRLRRIEREANVDLSRGEDRLALHVSLRLLQLFQQIPTAPPASYGG